MGHNRHCDENSKNAWVLDLFFLGFFLCSIVAIIRLMELSQVDTFLPIIAYNGI